MNASPRIDLEMDMPRRTDAAVVFRAGLARALASRNAEALSAVAQGCLVCLYRHAVCKRDFAVDGSVMSELDAKVALSMRGVTAGEIELILQALLHAQLVVVDGGLLRMPELDEALLLESQKLAARVAGWKSRLALREDAGGEAPARATSPAVRSSPPPTPFKPEDTQKTRARGPNGNRIAAGGEPSADDLTIVRIVCKDGVAELTDSYVGHLRTVYPRLDVEQQLRAASHWCESNPSKRKTIRGIRAFVCKWLNNARESSDMRAMVLRAQASRNGFGQGGGYSDPQPIAPSVGELDDLSDLNAPLSAVEVPPCDLSTAAVPESRPNPVLAARQRGRPASAGHRQRRLSEASLG